MSGINAHLEEANRRLAAALRTHTEAAAFLEGILASIPSGIVVVDRQGLIVLLNRAAESITGHRFEEVKGRAYAEVLGAGVAKQATPLYTLATGYCADQEEKTLHTQSGNDIPVSCSTSLIQDSDGNIAGAIEVITDLRRIKLLEDEVSRTKTLATIGQVAAVVAHEIRNPLAGMKGFASLLERDLDQNPESLALAKRISQGIGDLERIVSDLLEAGRNMRLRPKCVDLLQEITRVVEMFRMAVAGEDKDIQFKIEASEGPIYCRVDPDRLRQATTNLLRNACEAVGAFGLVTVKVGIKRRDAATGDSGDGKALRDYIYVEVIDTGPGISKDVLEEIFSPFFTTKPDGTGLGLPTVRRIAELHGGRVRYSRIDGGGSSFMMEIPRR
jgi:PAS domain S-box-containing protein